MTTNEAYLQLKHMFNMDDSYKSSFIHWIKMFTKPMDKNERTYLVVDFIEWMEAILYTTISEFNRRRVNILLDSCIVFVEDKKKIPSIVINRSLKEMKSDIKHLDDVAMEVCQEAGYTVEDLKSESRKTEIVSLRIRFIKETFIRYRFSDKDVADYLNLHRTTVIYHRNDGVLKAKKRRYQRMRSL